MVFCAKCGNNLTEEMQFCPRCGAAVVQAPTTQLTNPVETAPDSRSNKIISEKKQQKVQQVKSSIPLMEGETILWHRDITHGLLHKEIIMEEAVTNKRCLKYDIEKKDVVAQIGISQGPDVVVMNVHRVNDSLGGGVFLTPRIFGLPGGFGVYGGPRRGNIKVFGDVSIMKEGKVIMTFENIQAPQGLRFLIETLKREQGLGSPRGPRPWHRQRFRPQEPDLNG